MITANIALHGLKDSSVTYASISIAASIFAYKMYLYTVYEHPFLHEATFQENFRLILILLTWRIW